MALEDINLIRGTTYQFDVLFRDNKGDPIDITGWEVWFTVRLVLPPTSETDDTDAAISKNFTGGDTTGIADFELTEVDTNIDPKEYYYDIQYKNADGAIKSLGVSKFKVSSDVTRDK